MMGEFSTALVHWGGGKMSKLLEILKVMKLDHRFWWVTI